MYKSKLLAHIIFVCKYRKKLLQFIDAKPILLELSNNSDFQINTIEQDIDHIHFIVDYPPTLSITQIVRRLKQQSTIKLWQKHGDYLSQHFWKERTFQTDGYYAASIGDASTEMVKRYIENQGN